MTKKYPKYRVDTLFTTPDNCEHQSIERFNDLNKAKWFALKQYEKYKNHDDANGAIDYEVALLKCNEEIGWGNVVCTSSQENFVKLLNSYRDDPLTTERKAELFVMLFPLLVELLGDDAQEKLKEFNITANEIDYFAKSDNFDLSKVHNKHNPFDEMIDNCDNKTFDCDACPRNGDCVDQGIDGRPRWEDEEDEM